MTKHKPGTVFEREYKDKKVKVTVTKGGQYKVSGGKLHDSISAAVKEITKGKAYPATVFFKTGAGTGKKRAARKGKNAVEVVDTPAIDIRGMIHDIVQAEVHKIVVGEVTTALQDAFRTATEQ